jgi:hypothetical protein
MFGKTYSRVFIASFVLVLLSHSNTSLAGEARSFAITKWDGDCSGSTRKWWDDMCMAWRKRMGSKGWDQWWSNFSNVRISKFVDPAKASWGKDNAWNGIDRGDAALLCTHGGYDDNGWYGVMHTKENNECGLNTNQMQLGKASGGNLRFYHMSSCHSVRWDRKTKWFDPAAGKVHVITGFHGLMYIGSKYVDEYRDLAKYGFSSKGVGKVWVDEMHHVDHWYNSWKTVCPIALGFGDTEAASANALNEKYTSNWTDKNPNWVTWRYISKCDPDDGPKLPN